RAEIENVVLAAAPGADVDVVLTGHLMPTSDPTGPHWPRWQEALSAGFGYVPDDFAKWGATSCSDFGWVQQTGMQEILLTGLARLPRIAFAETPKRGGALRMSLDQAASVIHPMQARVNPEYLVTELLYSNLTRLKPDMTVEPDLAISWEPNATLTEWIFKLRPGVTFHDGSPLTADDVVATINALLDPKTASPGPTNV